MDEVTRGYWASALCNNDLICIETYSGYRGPSRIDPKGAQHLLPVGVGDEELGTAALDAMARSRFVLAQKREERHYPADIIFDMDLYDYESTIQRYKDKVKKLMELYSYKTKKKLFSDMKYCDLASKNGIITIRPNHHEKLEAWGSGDLTEADNVVIPDTSSAAEVGAALRLAFSRCTGGLG